jgi:hypothetical protein
MGIFTIYDIERMKAKNHLEGLIEALGEKQPLAVRQAAVEALGEVGDKRAAEALISLSTASEGDLHVMALMAMMQIANRKSRSGFGNMSLPRGGGYVLVWFVCVLIGIIPWALLWFLFGHSLVDSESDTVGPAQYVSVLLWFGLMFLAVQGWDWMPYPFGSYGWFIKYFIGAMIFAFGFAFVALDQPILAIGALSPIFYGTGKSAARWLSGLQG